MYVQHEMIRLNFATKHEMLQVGQKLVDNQVVVIKNQKVQTCLMLNLQKHIITMDS